MKIRNSKGGNALVVVVLMTAGMAGMGLAMASSLSSGNKQERGYREETTSMLAAEAGVAEAVYELRFGQAGAQLTDGGNGEVWLGSEDQPRGIGDAAYWVQLTDAGGGQFAVRSTGQDREASTRIELLLQQSAGSFFQWAAFGDERLSMDSNAFVDSYNSSLGTYASQEVNGAGSNAWASDDGNIGSNADIQMDGNTLVYGNAQPGPGSSVSLTGTAYVDGATTAASDLVDMPPIVRPSFGSAGDVDTGGNASVTLVSGEYEYDSYLVGTNATVMVEGPATLVFQSLELRSGSEFLVDATNGPVEIFVVGDYVMNSNTLMSSLTSTPADLSLNLESDNVIDPNQEVDLDQVDFESNAELFGTIYAPNAAVEINSNFELFGSLVARRVHLDSNARVHFDEALLTGGDGASASFTTICWRVLPD